MDSKKCVDCGVVKPLAEFYDAKGYAGGKHTCCKPCFRIRNLRSKASHADARSRYHASYRLANRDVLRAYSKRRKAEKIAAMSPNQLAEFRLKRAEAKRIHRAKKYGSGGRHTEAEWQVLLGCCGRKCVKCGIGERLTRDHIVPLTAGGSDSIENIQPLCRSCNSSKNKWHATDYRTGEVLKGLTDTVASARCKKCGVAIRLTNVRRKFCSPKCCWDTHNAAKRAKQELGSV